MCGIIWGSGKDITFKIAQRIGLEKRKRKVRKKTECYAIGRESQLIGARTGQKKAGVL